MQVSDHHIRDGALSSKFFFISQIGDRILFLENLPFSFRLTFSGIPPCQWNHLCKYKYCLTYFLITVSQVLFKCALLPFNLILKFYKTSTVILSLEIYSIHVCFKVQIAMHSHHLPVLSIHSYHYFFCLLNNDHSVLDNCFCSNVHRCNQIDCHQVRFQYQYHSLQIGFLTLFFHICVKTYQVLISRNTCTH